VGLEVDDVSGVKRAAEEIAGVGAVDVVAVGWLVVWAAGVTAGRGTPEGGGEDAEVAEGDPDCHS